MPGGANFSAASPPRSWADGGVDSELSSALSRASICALAALTRDLPTCEK